MRPVMQFALVRVQQEAREKAAKVLRDIERKGPAKLLVHSGRYEAGSTGWAFLIEFAVKPKRCATSVREIQDALWKVTSFCTITLLNDEQTEKLLSEGSI